MLPRDDSISLMSLSDLASSSTLKNALKLETFSLSSVS